MSFKRPPTPVPLHPLILERNEEYKYNAPISPPLKQTEYIYINSSNGYLDKQITVLNERVHHLEREIKLLKILLEKQNK
jgi:hypothetical protein